MHTRSISLCSLALVVALPSACKSDEPANGESSSDDTGGGPSSGNDSTDAGSVDSTDDTVSPTSGDPSSSTDSTDPDSSSGDTGEVVLNGACPLETKVGAFNLLREQNYTTFSGAVADGVVPISVLENVGEGSGCTLLRRNNPFCDPTCGPNTTCDFDGNCIPYPANHDVGSVTVDGLLAPLMVDPVMPTYEYFDTQLMHPAWDLSAAITLSAPGGDYEAFELHGAGVAMIEPAGDLVLDETQDLDIAWIPSDRAGVVRVTLNIDQHGLTPVELYCESEDTGMLTLPVDLIAEFVSFGVTGFPSANYFLETVDSVELTPGCVDFGVRSQATGGLSVVGHTPCDQQEDCPEGQICDLKIQTCM